MSEKLSDIKKKLLEKNNKELVEIILGLAKSNKRNKEFIRFVLLPKGDEDIFLKEKISEIEDMFYLVNSNPYFAKKTLSKIVRKILAECKTVKTAEIEIQLWICFIKNFLQLPFDGRNSFPVIQNMYKRALEKTDKSLEKMHEDLQFDYRKEIQKIITH